MRRRRRHEARAAGRRTSSSARGASRPPTARPRSGGGGRAASGLGATLEFVRLDGDARLEDKAAHALRLAAVIRRVRPGSSSRQPSRRTSTPTTGAWAASSGTPCGWRASGACPSCAGRPIRIQQLLYYAVAPGCEPRGSRRSSWTYRPRRSSPRGRPPWRPTPRRCARAYVELQLARARVQGLRAGVGFAIALYPNDPLVVDSLARPGRTGADSDMAPTAPSRSASPATPRSAGAASSPRPSARSSPAAGTRRTSSATSGRSGSRRRAPRLLPPGGHQRLRTVQVPRLHAAALGEDGRGEPGHRLDVLHVHYAVPHATAAILAQSMLPPEPRPRVVATLHGTDTTLLGRDPGTAPPSATPWSAPTP